MISNDPGRNHTRELEAYPSLILQLQQRRRPDLPPAVWPDRTVDSAAGLGLIEHLPRNLHPVCRRLDSRLRGNDIGVDSAWCRRHDTDGAARPLAEENRLLREHAHRP
jgi:hypothetical protein